VRKYLFINTVNATIIIERERKKLAEIMAQITVSDHFLKLNKRKENKNKPGDSVLKKIKNYIY